MAGKRPYGNAVPVSDLASAILDPVLRKRAGISIGLVKESDDRFTLLTDIMGDEVLATLQRDPELRSIPVVVISADATPRSINRLRAQGADAYLTKPLDVDEFLSTIDRLLPEPAVGAAA